MKALKQMQRKDADAATPMVPEIQFAPQPLSQAALGESDDPARDKPRQPSSTNVSIQSEPIDEQLSTPTLLTAPPEPESEPPAEHLTQTQTRPTPKPNSKTPFMSTPVTNAWDDNDSNLNQDEPTPPAKRSRTAASSSDDVFDYDINSSYVPLYFKMDFTGYNTHKTPWELRVYDATRDPSGKMRLLPCGVTTAVWAPGTPKGLDANQPTNVSTALSNARLACTGSRLFNGAGESVPKQTFIDPACKTPLRAFIEDVKQGNRHLRELLKNDDHHIALPSTSPGQPLRLTGPSLGPNPSALGYEDL
jgi:hypothetical protein